MNKTITKISADDVTAAVARAAKATKLTPEVIYLNSTAGGAQAVFGIPFQSSGTSANANVAISDLASVLTTAIKAGKTIETWGDGTFYIEDQPSMFRAAWQARGFEHRAAPHQATKP